MNEMIELETKLKVANLLLTFRNEEIISSMFKSFEANNLALDDLTFSSNFSILFASEENQLSYKIIKDSHKQLRNKAFLKLYRDMKLDNELRSDITLKLIEY